MDDLIGKRLVAVERLAWSDLNGPADLRRGPAHLHFDGGRGVFLSGATDWQLEIVVTRAGDEAWLLPYQYDFDGSHWTMRDASREPPFETVLGALLESWEALRNEVGEQVGLALRFDCGTIALKVYRGELRT